MYDPRRISVLLLAAVVSGGMLAPVVHRVQHGLTWIDLVPAPDDSAACEHSLHDTAFEVAGTPLHDVQCVQCRRTLDSFDLRPTTIVRLHTPATPAAWYVSQYCVPLLSNLTIRGPPGRA